MRYLLYLCLATIILSFALPAGGQEAETDILVKSLYALPTTESKVVYDIPIEVRLLGFSEDRNWYRIKVSFGLGVLGTYTYIGWAQVPIGASLEAAALNSESRPASPECKPEDARYRPVGPEISLP